MQVTRQRLSGSEPAPERRRTTRRIRVAAAGTAALTIVGGGIATAATGAFGNHTVGTQYANGLQISDNQVIKPIGDRIMTQYGKFMGSTVSADGRFLAASSADKSVVLQVFDLAANKLIYRVGKADGVDQKLPDGSVGQEGPTYSPDGRFLWLSTAGRPHPLPGQRRRHPRQRHPLPAPAGRRPLRPARQVGLLARRVDALRRGQRPEHRCGHRPGDRRGQADLERRHRAEAPDLRRRQALRQQRGRPARQAGRAHDQLLRHRRPRRPQPRRLDDRHRQRHRHGGPSGGGPRRSTSACTRPRCMPRATPLFVANTNSDTRVGRSTPARTLSSRPSRPQPWPKAKVGYEPTGIALTQGRTSSGHPRPGERGRRLPIRRDAAGAGRATSACCRRTTTPPAWPRLATGSSSPTLAASTPAVRPSPRTRATASPSSAGTTRTARPRP